MKAHKRLMQSLADAQRMARQKAIADWLKTQPGSVRRGFARGRVELPKHLQ